MPCPAMAVVGIWGSEPADVGTCAHSCSLSPPLEEIITQLKTKVSQQPQNQLHFEKNAPEGEAR